jgi:hypothetical protein
LRITCTLILFFEITLSLSAQNLSNLRSRKLALNADTVQLDSLSLVPGSVIITSKDGNLLNDSAYKINYARSLLISSRSLSDSIFVSYRVFPFFFPATYQHRSLAEAKISSDGGAMSLVLPRKTSGNVPLLGNDDLNKQGSIARGISFGNNQDAVVNSQINLQLNGRLSNDLNITAAIADDNIPVQDEGYTQQIQEFDRVYITLYNEKFSLTAGDFSINQTPGYFLKFSKKIRGLEFTGNWKQRNTAWTFTQHLSGAVAKGKYRRQIISGVEGNQGPYNLTGNLGETYVLVLAGSEKVYLDGKLLKRGEDADYVIDYNNAELSFTAACLITKDSRIVVEFEYSDKNYARFMAYASSEWNSNKGNFWFNFFSESDNKNQPLQQSLTNEEKQILALAGDNLDLMVVPNVDSVAYSNELVLYRKTDTLVNSVTYTVYVYSTDSLNACYKVGFSYVGADAGDYVQIASDANGKVYKWVAPLNGTHSGSYMPIQQLVPPQKKQVFSAGGAFSINPRTKLLAEISATHNNANSFSSIDKSNDDDLAFRFSVDKLWFTADTSGRKLQTTLAVFYSGENFDPVDRFRDTEFERDWNITDTTGGNEKQVNLGLNYSGKSLNKLIYKADWLNRSVGFNGLRQQLISQYNFLGNKLDLNVSVLNSKAEQQGTRFLRHKITLSHKVKVVTLGLTSEGEYNIWDIDSTSVLGSESFAWQAFEAGLFAGDSLRQSIRFYWRRRLDWLPKNSTLKSVSHADDFSAVGFWGRNPEHTWKVIVTYRRLNVSDTVLLDADDENTLLGRLENNQQFFKGGLAFVTFFELGSGLEERKEFSYLKVSQGQGLYTWNDYNENNRKELNEFEIAAYSDEADYIRLWLPTGDYSQTYSGRWGESMLINASRLIKNKSSIGKMLSKLSNRFSYNLDRKDSRNDLLNSLNPFIGNSYDTSLINLTSQAQNIFSINNLPLSGSSDYQYTQSNSRLLLVNGFDSRTVKNHTIKIRCIPWSGIVFSSVVEAGRKEYQSEYFSSKDYSIRNLSVQTGCSFQPGVSRMVNLDGLWAKKQNIAGEEAVKKELTASVKLGFINKANLQLDASFIHFTYNAATATSIAYEMLEGLLPGANYTWQVQYRQRLTNGIDLELNYNGRKSDGSRTIHVGSMQVRASF